MGNSELHYDRYSDLNNRFTLYETCWQPFGINADATNAAEATRDIVGRNFEILGTNAVSADCTYDVGGGVVLSTHGASADSTILLPHLTAGISPFTGTKWNTAKSPSFDALCISGAAVTAVQYWAGFKLTNTPTLATDDDQIFFSYSSATNSGQWQLNWSIANVDYTYNIPTDIVAAVAASTIYRLRIEIDASRQAMGFINDRAVMPVKTGALTSLTTLIPYIGLKASAAAVKAVTVKSVLCSRAH